MNTIFDKLVVASTFALLALACDEQPVAAIPDEDPAEAACEQRVRAGTALTAGSTTAEAPSLELSQQPHTITLPSDVTTDTYAGYVRLPGPAEALLFVGTADVASELRFDITGEDELPEAAPNEFCPDDIPAHFDLELTNDGDYFLRLGPSAIESVWLAYVSAQGHDHLE